MHGILSFMILKVTHFYCRKLKTSQEIMKRKINSTFIVTCINVKNEIVDILLCLFLPSVKLEKIRHSMEIYSLSEGVIVKDECEFLFRKELN